MLHWARAVSRPWSPNSRAHHVLAKNPRSSSTRWGVITNTPANVVSLNSTAPSRRCAAAPAALHDSDLRDGNDEVTAARDELVLLRENLVGEVPRQQQHVVGHRFEQLLRRI